MRGEPVIFAKRVLDATARKQTVDGRTKRVSLKMGHWVAVIRAALDQHRIGELVMDAADGKGPRLVLHMPSPENERDIVVFHNRLMSLCGVTFSALAEKMSATAARRSSRSEGAKAKEVGSVARAEGDDAVPAPKPRKRRRLRPLMDASVWDSDTTKWLHNPISLIHRGIFFHG